jgi:dienelactone hydrolase
MSWTPCEYTHGDQTLNGRLAQPEGPGPHPAVLVMHSAMGLGPLVTRRIQDLAAAGYVALASDMYGVTPSPDDMDTVAREFMKLVGEPQVLRDRVVAAFDKLASLPGVDKSRISAVGYCFGGQCVLELARSGADLAAVVSFHGLLKTAEPAKEGEVKAKVLVITGALDPHAPLSDVATFQAEMTEAKADWQLTIYGSGWHSFTDDETGNRDDIPGVRYDPLLDRLSWAQATEFISANIGG